MSAGNAVNKYWMGVRVLLKSSLYASPGTVRNRYLVSSVRSRLNIQIRISRVLRTRWAPVPGKQATPIHRTLCLTLQLAKTSSSIPLGKNFDNHTSRFSEFVLDLDSPPYEFSQSSLDLWGNWDKVDELFESSLDRRPGFRLVIRAGTLPDRDEFQAQAKERFPLMAGRDRIQFETSLAVERCQGKCSLHRSVPIVPRIRGLIQLFAPLRPGCGF